MQRLLCVGKKVNGVLVVLHDVNGIVRLETQSFEKRKENDNAISHDQREISN